MESAFQIQTTVCYNDLTPPFREAYTIGAASASVPNFLSPKVANRHNSSWSWSHDFFPLFWTYTYIGYIAQQTKPPTVDFYVSHGLKDPSQFSASSCWATHCKEKWQGDSCQLHFKVSFQVADTYSHSMRVMRKTLEDSRDVGLRQVILPLCPFSVPLPLSLYPLLALMFS